MIRVSVICGLMLWAGSALASFELMILEGQDNSTRKECLLLVNEVGFSGPEKTVDQWYAKVQTSYSHGRETAEALTVRFHGSKPGVLQGVGANGKDQIVIFVDAKNPAIFDAENSVLASATVFNLKWWHHNHFDTHRCINLKVR